MSRPPLAPREARWMARWMARRMAPREALWMALWLALWAGLLAACDRAPAPPPVAPAAVDACLSCHDPAEGPAGTHRAEAMGCARCHLGDPAATIADAAHVGLEREPGALDTVDRTCGAAGCHADQAARVRTSLMATGAGIVAVDRWALGEQPLPDGHQELVEVLATPAPTPAEDHLRRLCAGCHLHARRANRDDAIQGIGAGCSACHSASRAGPFEAHPAIDLVVPDQRCLGCHSRSGRISLSYQGLAEARGVACDAPTTLHDGRPACRQPADLHHEAGLACTDCHLHTELMGDGTRHAHQEQATELRCETCHGPGAAETTWAEVGDATSRNLVRQHGRARAPEDPVRLGRRGTPVWNLVHADGGWQLEPKAGGEARPVPQTPADATHRQPGHDRLTCATCHTAWVPSCPDCHTRFDPQGSQWDFGAGAEAPGRWVEEAAVFSWGEPALGVRPDGRIGAAMPGMIWTLDATAAGGPALHARRYAAAEPHTTRREGRACASCHGGAAALGLGTGALDLAALRFEPATPDPLDPTRAIDAWVGLQAESPGQGTRVGARSLDATEQRRVLRVALCLPCHEAESAIYADFGAARGRLQAGLPRCGGTLPAWARRDP